MREDTRRLRRLIASGRAKLVSATVSYRHGTWTASLIVEAAALHPALRHPDRAREGACGWVGVDRGLAAFAVAARADGALVSRVDEPPRPLRAAEDRLRRRNRALSRARPGSKRYERASARLYRAHRSVRNVRHRFLHEAANILVNAHDRIALEDLHIRGMMANHRLAAAIADASWAMFARIIGYKQLWRGGQVAFVDRWFPSTKTCSSCRAVRTAMPLSVRTFHCPACGVDLDRDHNAAANLAIWAEEHHAQIRDPDAQGPVINVHRGIRSSRRAPRVSAGAGLLTWEPDPTYG